MRIVFCGTPQFAVPTLKHLLAQPDFEIAGVITQPDRPRGRGQELSFSPVKQVAKAAHLPVHQPEKIRAPGAQELLKQLSPDCVVIIAYGQIIPAGLLSIPTYGWINLHASLLPKYRGAAPINWAIVNGETRTGVTTIQIDAGMDTGDMLLQREIEIGPTETAPELVLRLSELGAPLMAETLRRLGAGTIVPRAQNHAEASYAPMLKKEDGRIDWNRSAGEIYNRMRGLAPWPGTYTTFRGQACHVLGEPVSKGVGATLPPSGAGVAPGTLFGEKNELFVMCGDATVLRVVAVKVEGRKQVSASEFANGARLKAGERFGNT
ncbi:MAG: methionyl-tRNA formyltransferase [Acidobacteria bacterium]|nr:MAG: methionyl-tRNA formyltransferase [Acidobacteriota bacterium]